MNVAFINRTFLFITSLALFLTGCQGVLEVRVVQEKPEQPAALGMVAYIVGGDVWLLDLDTDQPVRLTRDGLNHQPRLSPDNAWVAYMKGDLLFVAQSQNLTERQVSTSGVSQFSWSPLENRLVYVQPDGLNVWDAGTLKSALLVSGEAAAGLTQAAWDPSGSWLAYDNREMNSLSLGKYALTDNKTELLFTGQNQLQIPRLAGWSPDGQWLLAWIGSSYEIDGLPLCWISAGGGDPLCSAEKVLLRSDHLAFSPSGRLAVIAGEGRENWVNKGLALFRPGEQSLQWLVNAADQSPLQPAWSPDGSRVLYSAGPNIPMASAYDRRVEAMRDRRIWMVEVESGRRRQLTNDRRYRDERPLWSADGEYILFVRLDTQTASLWLMDADGGNLRQVVPELTPRPDAGSENETIGWGTWWHWNPSLPGKAK